MDERGQRFDRVARPLVQAAEKVGARRAALLKAARVAPASLDDLDKRISHAEFHRLIEATLDATGDPAFGLHCLQRMGRHAFNPVSDLVFHAPDLRQSMAALQKFHSLLADDVVVRVEESPRKKWLQR